MIYIYLIYIIQHISYIESFNCIIEYCIIACVITILYYNIILLDDMVLYNILLNRISSLRISQINYDL